MVNFDLAPSAGVYDAGTERFKHSVKLAEAKAPVASIERPYSAPFNPREKLAELILSGEAPADVRDLVCAAFLKTAAVSSEMRYRVVQKEARELLAEAESKGWEDESLKKSAMEKVAIAGVLKGIGAVATGLYRPLGGLGHIAGEAAGRLGTSGFRGAGNYLRSVWKSRPGWKDRGHGQWRKAFGSVDPKTKVMEGGPGATGTVLGAGLGTVFTGAAAAEAARPFGSPRAGNYAQGRSYY